MANPTRKNAWSRDLTGVVRTVAFRSFKPFLQSVGVDDTERLIRESGVEPDQLQDPAALFSLRACADMFEKAARETGREELGLDFGMQLPWEDLGILGYVMFNAPTLEAGLDAVSRFYSSMRIFGDFYRETENDDAHFSFSPQGIEPGGFRQIAYILFTLLVRFCREATGQPDLAPRRVCFTHAAPSDADALETFFRAPIRFSSPEDSFTLPAEYLELELGVAKPALLSGLRRHSRQLLESLPLPIDGVDEIRRGTTEALGDGVFQIDEIARRLDTSARTLQRRLQQAGTSYQQVLGETRLALAQLYLKDPSISLPEIAFLLGYSHQSVMSRAYRRWSGQTPLGFRRS
jgi:AraC-like DNA-binding protein